MLLMMMICWTIEREFFFLFCHLFFITNMDDEWKEWIGWMDGKKQQQQEGQKHHHHRDDDDDDSRHKDVCWRWMNVCMHAYIHHQIIPKKNSRREEDHHHLHRQQNRTEQNKHSRHCANWKKEKKERLGIIFGIFHPEIESSSSSSSSRILENSPPPSLILYFHLDQLRE